MPRQAAATLLGILLLAPPALASMEEEGGRLYFGQGRSMDIIFQFQIWNTTTYGAVNDSGVSTDSLNDTFVRRGRFGVKGYFRPDLRYLFHFAFDNLGKNPSNSAPGTPQPEENWIFGVWDAYVILAVQADHLYVTAGYFRPQVGRENITTAFRVNSLTKALPNNYVRKHMVGRPTGRETGIQVGGLFTPEGWSLLYHLGIFDTTWHTVTGDKDRPHWSPLWAGRLALTIGDPEMEKYIIDYKTNYFGQRKGLTLGFNGSYQGKTNQTAVNRSGSPGPQEWVYSGGFLQNRTFGVDLLANWSGLNVTAEYDWMNRRFDSWFAELAEDLTADRYTDRVGFVRAGFNLPFGGEDTLEPSAMYTWFTGDAHSVPHPDGREETWEVGLNWYQQEHRSRITAHYVWRNGREVSGYSETGRDAKGNYFALGLQLVF